MKWEFAYVDLWLGTDKTRVAIGEQMAQIAQLGTEGWEPVGQVCFEYENEQRISITVPQLMFKRSPSN